MGIRRNHYKPNNINTVPGTIPGNNTKNKTMERREYTIVTVSAKEVKNVAERICFDNEQAARTYAQGMFHGARLAGKNYGIMMLPGGVYAPERVISVNVTGKIQEVFLKYLYDSGKCYNLYIGYYELYISRRELGKPYIWQGKYYSLEAAQEAAEQYDGDAHIIYDRELANEVEEWAELADVEEYVAA